MLQMGVLPLQSLGSGEGGDVAERARTFARIEGAQLALSHARGMASVLAKGRRVVLLDLEEEGDGDDDDGAEDEEGGEEGGEEGDDAEVGDGGDESEGEDMAMEEDGD